MMRRMWGSDGQQLTWRLDPLEALRRWPADRAVVLFHSGRFDARWSRWSVLAEPAGAYRFAMGCGGGPTSGGVGAGTEPWSHEPFEDLQRVLADDAALWAGYLSYDLGRWVEALPRAPVSGAGAALDRPAWPIVEMHRCPGWLVHDGQTGRWSAHGTWADAVACPPLETLPPRDEPFEAAAPQPLVDRASYERSVQRVIDYIGAGDVFQVNLAQRFTAACRGEPRTLYRRLAQRSPAWYGAYLELAPRGADRPGRVVASTSPELFLELAPDGRVVTRPIKGTRPASTPAAELEASEKDTAELNMIVDLLRNDLGRVARFGSVRVDSARAIESHPTVHHGVATISARLREDRTLIDLLRAAMPGGSIIGAPKVRAMQIIDELEPVRRGPYCGAIGMIHAGRACFNIAIRTMLLELDARDKGRVDFSVGGGIVADSEPAAEYQETLDKAAAMVAALGGA